MTSADSFAAHRGGVFAETLDGGAVERGSDLGVVDVGQGPAILR
jgi:hypothetical protein